MMRLGIDAVSYTHLDVYKRQNNELMSFNGEPVIYYEAETKLTDEMIDLMIEEGAITEEHIEALGGRETLLNMPPVTQIGINAIVDGKAISITGTYNDCLLYTSPQPQGQE